MLIKPSKMIFFSLFLGTIYECKAIYVPAYLHPSSTIHTTNLIPVRPSHYAHITQTTPSSIYTFSHLGCPTKCQAGTEERERHSSAHTQPLC